MQRKAQKARGRRLDTLPVQLHPTAGLSMEGLPAYLGDSRGHWSGTPTPPAPNHQETHHPQSWRKVARKRRKSRAGSPAQRRPRVRLPLERRLSGYLVGSMNGPGLGFLSGPGAERGQALGYLKGQNLVLVTAAQAWHILAQSHFIPVPFLRAYCHPSYRGRDRGHQTQSQSRPSTPAQEGVSDAP